MNSTIHPKNPSEEKVWKEFEESSLEEYEYSGTFSKGTPANVKMSVPTSPMTPDNCNESSSYTSFRKLALYKEYCENEKWTTDLERTPSQLASLNLPSSPSDYRIRQISYHVEVIQTLLIPSIRNADSSHLTWVAPLGSGAVGMVLCPNAVDIAVKVSIYETGFDPKHLHPSKAEAQIMRRLFTVLRLAEKDPVSPHVAIILDDIYGVSLSSLQIPKHFWESSRSAKELQKWIGRNRNCDLSNCSLLFSERLEGGTLFRSLCRSSPDVKRQRSVDLEELSQGHLKTPKAFSQVLQELGVSPVDGIRTVAFQVLFTLAVIKELIPDFKHNDLSLANIMLRATHDFPVDLWESSITQGRETRSHSEHNAKFYTAPLRVYLYKYRNEKFLVPDLGFQPAIADFDFACIGNGTSPEDITNAKVAFFESRKVYEDYNIHSKRDDISDAQMFLSNLKDVALHNLQRELKSRSLFLKASPNKEESLMLDFFQRRVHPQCNDSQNRSLRGRLPPGLHETSDYYSPKGILKDTFFDNFRNMAVEYEKNPTKFKLLESYGIEVP
ncbi:serine/threonine-protein kinase [Galdieria sulphuraria]|uniref:Serine/threonine-protein kinase n=1 Tax=Galdieria sulphuraria TaxID=130081 RepID=M2W6N2_GALSU|nr:serine/threonine-protein kinase [Galdieria sulphuraria]EME31431.1 serine/threonine-protein kinase [Galdieria sulphuraria]|eukprot:XP_005707951.1 serine/threonine-protein kinase [Galdieria sulphuraria]